MSVNGVPTQGRTSFDIIDQVNEGIPPRRTITFTVLKGGDTSNQIEMELERSFVEVSNPITYKLDARDGKRKVGYVRIREFNSLVNPKVREALLDLKSQGANAFVIDLRSNPGGAFQSAVDVASLFMENKIATYFVDGNNIKTPFITSTKNVVVDEVDPIVIWIDRGSASASEVFAGAMHDNCRAVVMGDRSFGKGLIQSVFGLENGSGLVLTVAQYITPNGSVIQGSGIQPDIQAKLPMRIPFLGSGSDTSVVDFHQVSDLQSKLCSTSSSTSTMATVMDDR
jgi:C-terminal peptidase prc